MMRTINLIVLIFCVTTANAQVTDWLADLDRWRVEIERLIGNVRVYIDSLINPPAANQTKSLPPFEHRIPTLQRLERSHLQRVREESQAYRQALQSVTLKTGFKDYRCVLHAHSYLSHDSRGTIEEIAAAAKQVGVQAIFISDHPQEKDVVAEGARGIINDVLFVPGSETRGFLLYPGNGKLPSFNMNDRQLVDAVKASRGMVFVAHPEEPHDWSIQTLTGMEIYNTHTDVNDELELLKTLQPKDTAGYGKLLTLLNTFQDYPQESFSSLYDHPKDLLARYDTLCKTRPFTAIAANDSHQNTGFVVVGTQDGKYRVEDPLGEEITTLDPSNNSALKLLFGESQPGKVLFKRQLDPYPVSLGYVNTHILARERTERALRDALAKGRTYIAFDWIADATGTAFLLKSGSKSYPLGETVRFKSGMRLQAEVPLSGFMRLMRDGSAVKQVEGRTLDFEVQEVGIYRLEVYLPLGGELRGWIFTGAIRIVE
jgi:hypothetical protein